jgi:hypothetical protein
MKNMSKIQDAIIQGFSLHILLVSEWVCLPVTSYKFVSQNTEYYALLHAFKSDLTLLSKKTWCFSWAYCTAIFNCFWHLKLHGRHLETKLVLEKRSFYNSSTPTQILWSECLLHMYLNTIKLKPMECLQISVVFQSHFTC